MPASGFQGRLEIRGEIPGRHRDLQSGNAEESRGEFDRDAQALEQ